MGKFEIIKPPATASRSNTNRQLVMARLFLTAIKLGEEVKRALDAPAGEPRRLAIDFGYHASGLAQFSEIGAMSLDATISRAIVGALEAIVAVLGAKTDEGKRFCLKELQHDVYALIDRLCAAEPDLERQWA